MQLRNEIPDTFWGLFRSVNREIYIDALLYINEEYQYNNYFLTKEACIQVLGDMNAGSGTSLMGGKRVGIRYAGDAVIPYLELASSDRMA